MHQLPIVPIVSAKNVSFFAVDISPRTVKLGNHEILTAPLAFDKKFLLLGISSSSELYNSGTIDMTDSITPGAKLSRIYFKITKPGTLHRVVAYDVEVDKSLNKEVRERVEFPIKGNNRMVDSVNYAKNDIVFTRSSLDIHGQRLHFLGQTELRAEILVTGTLDRETGVIYLNIQGKLQNADECEFTMTALGYDLEAFRQNKNRRLREQVES